MASASREPPVYECQVCNDFYKKPKLLMCGHVLCRDCIVSWLQSNAAALCPLCQDTMVDTLKGQATCYETIADALADDVAMAALVESAKFLDKKHVCCIHFDVMAVSLCRECNDTFCLTCSDYHKKLPATRHHCVEDFAVLTVEKLATKRQAVCKTHSEKKAEVFCSTHHVPICHVCALLEHRNCPELSDLKKKSELAQGHLEQLLAELKIADKAMKQTINGLDHLVLLIDKNTQDEIQDLGKMCSHLHTLVDACQMCLTEAIQNANTKNKSMVAVAKDSLTKRQRKVASHKLLVERVQQTVSGSELFQMTTMLKARVHDLNHDLDATTYSNLKSTSLASLVVDPVRLNIVEESLSQLNMTVVPFNIKTADSSKINRRARRRSSRRKREAEPLKKYEISELLQKCETSELLGNCETSKPFEKSVKSEPLEKCDKSELLEECDKNEPLGECDKSEPLEECDKSGPLEECDKSEPLEECDKSELLEECDKSEPLEECDKSEPLEECDKSEPLEECDKSELLEECDKSEPLEEYGKSELLEKCDKSEPLEECDKSEPLEECGKSEPLEECDKSDPLEECDKSEPLEKCDKSEPLEDCEVSATMTTPARTLSVETRNIFTMKDAKEKSPEVELDETMTHVITANSGKEFMLMTKSTFTEIESKLASTVISAKSTADSPKRNRRGRRRNRRRNREAETLEKCEIRIRRRRRRNTKALSVETRNIVTTKKLYRQFKSILNKLTLKKFPTLVKRVLKLEIDTEERMKGVTNLLFEKALREPNSSVVYAKLCRSMWTLTKVPSSSNPGEFVQFRTLILTKCQQEFESNKTAEVDLTDQELEIAATPEGGNSELKEALAEATTKSRQRSIGNIQFIGELFNLKMLTENIIHDCICKLLKNHDSKSLECVCHLLTTVGRTLETPKGKQRMDQYLLQLNRIKSDLRIVPQIRFMIQDVIDLQQNNWIPHKKKNKPTTINQIHKMSEPVQVKKKIMPKPDVGHCKSGLTPPPQQISDYYNLPQHTYQPQYYNMEPSQDQLWGPPNQTYCVQRPRMKWNRGSGTAVYINTMPYQMSHTASYTTVQVQIIPQSSQFMYQPRMSYPQIQTTQQQLLNYMPQQFSTHGGTAYPSLFYPQMAVPAPNPNQPPSTGQQAGISNSAPFKFKQEKKDAIIIEDPKDLRDVTDEILHTHARPYSQDAEVREINDNSQNQNLRIAAEFATKVAAVLYTDQRAEEESSEMYSIPSQSQGLPQPHNFQHPYQQPIMAHQEMYSEEVPVNEELAVVNGDNQSIQPDSNEIEMSLPCNVDIDITYATNAESSMSYVSSIPVKIPIVAPEPNPVETEVNIVPREVSPMVPEERTIKSPITAPVEEEEIINLVTEVPLVASQTEPENIVKSASKESTLPVLENSSKVAPVIIGDNASSKPLFRH